MNIKFLSKIDGGLKFLVLVVLLYLGCAILNFELLVTALNGFGKLLKEVIPVILIVFIVMFLSNLLLDTEKISKYLGQDSGVSGFLISIIFGILSAGPIYMWYPLLADFKEKGMKNSLIATFLYNRAIKLQLLPLMIYYFSLKFTIILSLYMIIFSVINGILVGKSLTHKK
jgi:uncharacterized membrane protein YraQ (UPF0718 family)